jgi:hypothetical protein
MNESPELSLRWIGTIVRCGSCALGFIAEMAASSHVRIAPL